MPLRPAAHVALLLAALGGANAHAGKDQLAPFGTCRKDGKGRVPANLEQAVAEASRLLGKARLAEFKRRGPARYHHGFGTALRNCWGLWSGGSALGQWFAARGIRHPDDMSGIVLESLHRKLQAKPRDLAGQIKSYKAYWARQRKDDARGTHSSRVLFHLVPFEKGKGWVGVKGAHIPHVHDFFAKLTAHARAGVGACWDKLPKTSGKSAVDTAVRVTLDEAGRIASAKVMRTMLHPAHAACMARALVGARSPKHAGAKYTLVLQSYRE